MDKRKIFGVLLTIILSVIALFFVVKLVFRTDKINEGKFRIADVILTSTAELTDKTEQNGSWSLNISQKNLLSMLIAAGSDASIERIYLSDLKVTGNRSIVFYLSNSENRIELSRKKQELDVEYILDDSNQIKLEFIALNENVVKNWIVPESLKEIICDGRIFETAGLALDDLEYTLSFKLSIVETNGKTNTLKVKLDVPKEELVTSGADVRRLSLTDFKFKVK